MTRYNHAFFLDPKIKYPSDQPDLGFSDYVSQCKKIIAHTRLDLTNNPNADLIIETNSPFELKPTSTAAKKGYGVLLAHGLYDCPFVMKELGVALQAQGLLGRSILLPGHGTQPGSLLNVTYQDWIQAVDYGVRSLSKEVEQIFLVGFSTGASLMLHQVLKNAYTNIAGLVMLAPAIKISSLASIANLPPKLDWLTKKFDWFRIAKETDYAKYSSFTFNSAYQIYLLTQQIKKLSASINTVACPVFVCLSEDDETISSKAALAYFQQYADLKSQLIIYSKQPQEWPDNRIIKRPAAYRELRGETIVHTAIPISPDNYHYGVKGDYVKQQPKARLLFNPDFDFLQQTVTQFVTALMPS